MSELLSAAQMRAIEQAAIAGGDVTGLELMERAGEGVVAAMLAEWPDLGEGARTAVVLCGPGNNGGDGFVIARLLKDRGWTVEVFLYGDPARLPPDAKVNCDRWAALGETHVLGMPHPSAEEIAALGEAGRVAKPTVIVDALFGTGLTRPISGLVQALRELQIDAPSDAAGRPYVVAVDVPSGLCADSGRVIGETTVGADLTVSFHRLKRGHVLAEGPEHCGTTRLVSIGLDDDLGRNRAALADAAGLTGDDRQKLGPVLVARLEADAGLRTDLDKAARGGKAHKYAHGHALVLTGSFGKTGAARLAARGALRIGAGLVTLGVPGAAQMEVASQITALMLTRVDNAEDLSGALEDGRINALCLGPGLGLERARALVPVALGDEQAALPKRGVLLDADALTAFREAPEELFALLYPGCVLTPHGGEFARLFPDIAARLADAPTRGPAYSRVDATREAAKRAGCVVLFKGPDTVIADPDGRCSVNAAVYDRDAPWLASAGSGDVLAGMITGLLARGLPPMRAAEAAAWLHVEAARHFGPGLIAEDLPEALPSVLRGLGL